MPVKNYDTVDGRLLGDRDPGNPSTTYFFDPSGTMTGAFFDGGADFSSFTPYGRGTEVAAFGWNGAWGYKPTGKSEASHYVRARSYSNTRGRWTSQDPLWPAEPAYGYVGGEPIQGVDPTGLSTCVRSRLKVGATCYIQRTKSGKPAPKRLGPTILDLDTCRYSRCPGPRRCSIEFSLKWNVEGFYGYERYRTSGPSIDSDCGIVVDLLVRNIYRGKLDSALEVLTDGAMSGTKPTKPGLGFGKYYYITCSGELNLWHKIFEVDPKYCTACHGVVDVPNVT